MRVLQAIDASFRTLRLHPPWILAGLLAGLTASLASELVVYAPGSPRGALSEATVAFTSETGIAINIRYGPSGRLREEIEAGAPAHVFTSGTMETPRALARSGRSGLVMLFARNGVCALVRDDFAVGTSTLLERLLS